VASTCAPHWAEGYKKGTLRHPGATCRGVGGHHAVSLKPLLGTSPASCSYRCPTSCSLFRLLRWHQKLVRPTLLMPRLLIPLTPALNIVRWLLLMIRSHLSKWRLLTLAWTRIRPTLRQSLQLLLATPMSHNAVTMRTANPRVTSCPWNSSHHLHHTPPPDMPFQPSDLSPRRRRRTTSPPPVATRIRMARRMQRHRIQPLSLS
jgi:hypothetical protein